MDLGRIDVGVIEVLSWGFTGVRPPHPHPTPTPQKNSFRAACVKVGIRYCIWQYIHDIRALSYNKEGNQ